MVLTNFMSEIDKQHLMQQDKNREDKMKEVLKESGLSDYGVEREAEILLMKPDKLEKLKHDYDNTFNTLLFYFLDEEFVEIKKVFHVLDYMENNCNQNWILLELVKLVEHNKILVDNKNKKLVVYNE